MAKRLFQWLLAVSVVLLWGCSDEGGEQPPAISSKVLGQAAEFARKERVVLDSYNVGNHVYVRSLAVDPVADRLWVGTSLGVHEVDLGSFEVLNTFTREQGLANEYVFAIGIDADGYKWFGTNAGGMSRYKDGEWKTFFPMHGLADYWVYSFANHPDGSLWVGTWAGVNRVDRETEQFETYVTELVNEWVYGLDVDSQERVWFGTEGGVSMFDGQQWRSWTHEDGMGAPNKDGLAFSTNTGLGTRNRHDLGVLSGGIATYNPNYVFSLIVDDRDRIWAGTWGGGVAVLEDGKWRNFTTADGLGGDIVYSVMQDSQGGYWFGTNSGVTYYDGQFWQTLSRDHGLLGNDVYALAETPSGDIWVGTRGGASRIGKRPASPH